MLELADVYAAVSYYLRNKDNVEAYLQRRREQSCRIREQNEARSTYGIRERLIARQRSRS